MSTTNDIIVQGEKINFCPGPCNSIEPEPPKKQFGKETWYSFKPHSGGRYQNIQYPMSDGGNLILENVRICRSCCYRHIEFEEEELYEYLHKDSEIIIKKLKKTGHLDSKNTLM